MSSPDPAFPWVGSGNETISIPVQYRFKYMNTSLRHYVNCLDGSLVVHVEEATAYESVILVLCSVGSQ